MPDSPHGYQSPRLELPGDRGMVLLAIAVLAETTEAARPAPMPLPHAAHLALGTLMDFKVAEDHQTGRFVEAVTGYSNTRDNFADYMRETVMDMMIAEWRSVVNRRDRARLGHGEELPALVKEVPGVRFRGRLSDR